MLGRTHSATGVVAGLGLSSALALDPPTAAAVTVTCAGLALYPDYDHPSATLARMYGPPTKLLSQAVNFTAKWFTRATGGTGRGGHRTATHWAPLAVPLAAVTGYAAGTLAEAYPLFAWIVFFAAASAALCGLIPNQRKKMGMIGTAVVAAGIASAVMWFIPAALDPWLLAVTMGLGVLVHILGDSVTTGGIPWLGPLNGWKNVKLPGWLSFTTGSAIEQVIFVLCIIAAIALAWNITGLTAAELGLSGLG